MLKDELARVRAEMDAVPDAPDTRALEETHRQLLGVADALVIVARTAPERLPALLHELDVRFVIGPEGNRLVWGEVSGAFLL